VSADFFGVEPLAACMLNAGLTSAWADINFLVPQIVMGCGLALSFTGLVSLLVQMR